MTFLSNSTMMMRRIPRWMAARRWRHMAALHKPQRLFHVPNARYLSCLDPKKSEENEEDRLLKKSNLPFLFALDPTLLATAADTSMHPIAQHLLETLITWGVPTTLMVASLGVVSVWSRRSKPKSSGRKKHPKESSNPATELYDDLYVSDKEKENLSPAEEIRELFKDLSQSRRSKKNELRRQNRGIPPQQYIAMTHWNQKLQSFQYSFTSALQSKAKAAAQYRQHNFDRALGKALNNLGGTLVEPHTRAKLFELEQEFLQEGGQLVETIQKLQTKLTQQSIEEEMERMGVTPFEMDPAEPHPGNEDQPTNKTAVEAPSKDDDNKGEPAEEMLGISQFEAEDLKKQQEEQQAAAQRKLEKEADKKDPFKNKKSWKQLQEAQRKLMELELQFIQDLVNTLGTQRASAIRVALLGDIAARGSGGLLTQLQERPLSTMLQALEDTTTANAAQEDASSNEMTNTVPTTPNPTSEEAVIEEALTIQDKPSEAAATPTTQPPKHLFVTRFPGDMRASQVEKLREEVTAIIRNASPEQDEALVILASGGGTVTGYGLAAGQLQRLKQAGLKLTVVVEEVAASGGYMMCCVGDRIIGSPFAAFGSIGVLTEIPNVHSRLKREGVEWQTVTAGDYKRTLTPFKEVTQEDFDKTKDDLESILSMFQKFVKENRPQLDIEAVATGEVWFGTDAVEQGLCDEIRTADDVLMDYVDQGWEVFEVQYKKPKRLARFRGMGGSTSNILEDEEERDGILSRGVRWLVRSVVGEVKSILVNESEQMVRSKPQEQRYLARFDGADWIRTESSKH